LDGLGFLGAQNFLHVLISLEMINLILVDWKKVSNDGREECALSSADFANYTDKFTFLNFKVHIFESDDVFELSFLFLLLSLLLFLVNLFLQCLFGLKLVLILDSLHLFGEFVEMIANVHGLNSPGEALVFNVDDILRVLDLFNVFVLVSLFLTEESMNPHHGHFQVDDLVSDMVNMSKRASDSPEKHNALDGDWKAQVFSRSNVE